MDKLDPTSLGLSFEPVLEEGLRAGQGAVDFGQLFLGLSMFIIASALLLTSLLFSLNVEQRSEETGTLLSLGIPPSRVRGFFLLEGLFISIIGCAAGTALGILYNRVVLYGLNTVWQGAVGMPTTLSSTVAFSSLLTGFLSSIALVMLVLWITIRRLSKKSLTELRGSVTSKSRTRGEPCLNHRPGTGHTLCKCGSCPDRGIDIRKDSVQSWIVLHVWISPPAVQYGNSQHSAVEK